MKLKTNSIALIFFSLSAVLVFGNGAAPQPAPDKAVLSIMVVDNGQPDWQALLDHPNIKLHLYGKKQARPGRKMGHYNVIASSIEEALQLARSTQHSLTA